MSDYTLTPQPTRVAIYARHSTNMQGHSTQDQIRRCEEFCKDRNFEISGVFFDEAVSGDSIINRPGIQDLVNAAFNNQFDRVIAEDLSRFSRDQGDIAHFFKKLNFLDIALQTVSEGDINELHIGLKGTMNALYLKDLADKTHRGMIASVLKGAVPGGRAFGYDIFHALDSRGEPIRGKRKINEKEAEVVRWIFDEYLNGASTKRIAQALNDRKIISPKGAGWGATTLIGQLARKTGLLRQTLYNGEVTFNRMTYRKHPETGKRVSILRPENEWIHVPIPELIILKDGVFEETQKTVEKRSSLYRQRQIVNQRSTPEEIKAKYLAVQRKHRKVPAKDRKVPLYIVSGKLWCSEHAIPIATIGRQLYGCPEKRCANHKLRLDKDLMSPVLKSLWRFDENTLVEILDTLHEKREGLQAKIDHLHRQITEHKTKIHNILDALSARKGTAETVSFLDELEADILKMKYDLKQLENKLAPIADFTKKEITRAVAQFKKAVLPLRNTDFNQEATLKVLPWIERLEMSAQWNDLSEQWDRSAKTVYKATLLLPALRALL